MPKRSLSPAEAFELRQALHLCTLDALMGARRWEAGELIFQGGTSLHLSHGSPRFSEDLDFLVRRDLKVETLRTQLQARLEAQPWIPRDLHLQVKAAKHDHNPVTFVVALSGEDVIGAVRVKLELWKTAPEAIAGVQASVAPVRLISGPAAGATAHVPTAELEEIYADKVFALAARSHLKPRDVFDLHWLVKSARVLPTVDPEAMRVRFATYPNTTHAMWRDAALARIKVLQNSVREIQTDLQRWLPSTIPLSLRDVVEMVANSAGALDEGLAALEALERPVPKRAAAGAFAP